MSSGLKMENQSKPVRNFHINLLYLRLTPAAYCHTAHQNYRNSEPQTRGGFAFSPTSQKKVNNYFRSEN